MGKRLIRRPLSSFNLLKEVAFLNKSVLFIQYPDGHNSFQVLFIGSAKLPRKQKKYLRRLIANANGSNDFRYWYNKFGLY